MDLHHKISGDGEPVVLLHGLFGDANNLGKLATSLAETFQVHALDARNHGRSPHASDMSYEAMAQDVLAYLDRHRLERVRLFGHSMGGKTAMTVALTAPERIQKLLVADISPNAYSPHHNAIFSGLASVDLTRIKSRQEAEAALSEFVEEVSVRQFLLKNLYRNEDRDFAWRFNLPVLVEQYHQIIGEVILGAPFSGEVMFVGGELSDYILPEHQGAIAARFPNASFRMIQGAQPLVARGETGSIRGPGETIFYLKPCNGAFFLHANGRCAPEWL